MFLIWLSAALAGAPTGSPASFFSSEGEIYGLTSTSDGNFVGGVTASGRAIILDVDQWRERIAGPCTVRSIEIDNAPEDDGSRSVYLGCADGTMHRWSLSANGFTAEDPALTVTVDEGNPLEGAWLNLAGDTVYTAAVSEEGQIVLHARVAENLTASDQGNYPLSLLTPQYFEAVSSNSVNAEVADRLVISHQDSQNSSVMLSDGTSSGALFNPLALTPNDVAAIPDAQGNAMVGTQNGRLAILTGTGGQSSVSVILNDLPTVNSLSHFYVSDSKAYMVLQAGDGIQAHEFNGSGGTNGSDGASVAEDATTSFSLDAEGLDMVSTPNEYVWMGSVDDGLVVLTDRPWVESMSISPTEGEVGTSVEISFDVDRAGQWTLYAGGDRAGSGTEIATGEADEAGTESVSLEIPEEGFEEGVNGVYVLLESEGLTGHDRTSFTFDSPPKAVELTANSVGFGDAQLTLTFDALEASDIVSYNVYYSDEPFKAADWQEVNDTADGLPGGPEYTEGDEVSPKVLEQSEGGTVSGTISPLTNDKVYYVGVRAVDATGLEGPMSAVISETPRPAFLVSERVGETGGVVCGTANGPAGLLALLGGTLLALGRRRRVVPVLAAAFALAITTSTAQAQDAGMGQDGKKGVFMGPLGGDQEPVYGYFGLSYGTYQPDQTEIVESYKSHFNNWQFKGGVQFFRIAQVDLAVGYTTKRGVTLAEDGAAGGVSRLRWIPLWGGLTLRGQFVENQPLVPYASVGGVWAFWGEPRLKQKDVEGDREIYERDDAYNVITGQKGGWYWRAGGAILLDWLDRKRASMLEARTGIHDTWLTLEYRQDFIGRGTPGLDLSGWSFNAGLQIDF